MILTGDEIIKAHRGGTIAVDPFCLENVNTCSYDVTLGPWFYRQMHPTKRPAPFAEYKRGIPLHPARNDYNPYAQKHIEASWRLYAAEPVGLIGLHIDGVNHDDLVVPIEPKEIILAHTLEFIGSVPQPEGISITTAMHSRSSSVRNCIDVCGSGGWGDHAFFSRWTMEVVNHSPHYTCYLVVGRRIAQISFHRTAPIQRTYRDITGKYQLGDSLEELKRSWTPEMMLPRMYQDREVGKSNRHRRLIQELIHKYPIEQ